MDHYFLSIKARRHLVVTSLLLLCLARGGALLQFSTLAREGFNGKGEMMMMMAGSKIGSRPPLCVGICRDCGRCEAVQVPAIPRQRNGVGELSAAMKTRGDYSSNYKPLSWKCRCGDVIVDP